MTVSHRVVATTRFISSARKWTMSAATVICIGISFIGTVRCYAQDAASGPACAISKSGYHCNVDAFKATIASAKTFAIKSSPRDRIGLGQLQSFGASLGKSLALANQPADLTFVLNSFETGGVNYGAMDRELATLKIYAKSPSGEPQSLVWVETLSGQPDLPWAAVVRSLLEQLRGRLTDR